MSDEFNIDILLQTPENKEEEDDVLTLQDDNEEESQFGEEPQPKMEQESEPSGKEEHSTSSSSGAPPPNQLALEQGNKDVFARLGNSSSSSGSLNSDQQKFIDKVVSVQGTGTRRRQARYDPTEKYSRGLRSQSAARANYSSSSQDVQRVPSGPLPRPNMANILQGREDLLNLATQAVAANQAYPLIQAYLSQKNVPRNVRDAAVQGIWDVKRPKIGSILLLCSYQRDPIPNYTKMTEIPLLNPRNVQTVLHRLKEGNPIMNALLYAYHAMRTQISPETTSYMLINRCVMQKETTFYHQVFPTTDDKQVGRDEAMLFPQRLDIKERGNFYQLQVHLKLYGPIHFCSKSKEDIERSTSFLLDAGSRTDEYTAQLQHMINA
jgi:hypothetical protein